MIAVARTPGVLSGPIPSALVSYIATRDRKLEKLTPWNPRPLADAFEALLRDGEVVMGGRSTCGAGAQDPSWVQFSAWGEVVRKARGLGFDIREQDIPQRNAWATKARGWWQESRYTINAEEAA